MPLTDAEITPGLVLHMDPAVLAQHGAKCSVSTSYAVELGHFFVCVATNGGTSVWLPVYSTAGDTPGRVKLDATGKVGHVKWTGGESWFKAQQTWSVPSPAVVRAASKADMSRPGSRNRYDASKLPNGLTLPT